MCRCPAADAVYYRYNGHKDKYRICCSAAAVLLLRGEQGSDGDKNGGKPQKEIEILPAWGAEGGRIFRAARS